MGRFVRAAIVRVGVQEDRLNELIEILIERKAYETQESARKYLEEVGSWHSAESAAIMSDLITPEDCLKRPFWGCIWEACTYQEKEFLGDQFPYHNKPLRVPFWIASVFAQLDGGQLPTYGQLQLFHDAHSQVDDDTATPLMDSPSKGCSSTNLDCGEWTMTPLVMWPTHSRLHHSEVAIFPCHDLLTVQLEPDEGRTARYQDGEEGREADLSDTFYFRCSENTFE